jgi:hypothetical protein
MIFGFRSSIVSVMEKEIGLGVGDKVLATISSLFSIEGNKTYHEICQSLDIATIIPPEEFNKYKFLKSKPQCSSWLINGLFGYNEDLAITNENSSLLRSDYIISKKLIQQIHRDANQNAVYELSQEFENMPETAVGYTKLTLKRTSAGFDKDEVKRLLDSVKYTMSEKSVLEMFKFLRYVYENGVDGIFVVVDKQIRFDPSHHKSSMRKHFNLFRVQRVNEEVFEIYFDLKFENCSFTITHSNQGHMYKMNAMGGSSERLLLSALGVKEKFLDDELELERNRKERRQLEKKKF